MRAEQQQWLCVRCGTVSLPEYYRAGSVLVNVLLLFLFIVPGIIYWMWSYFASYWGCSQCGSAELIPPESPKGKQLVTEV